MFLHFSYVIKHYIAEGFILYFLFGLSWALKKEEDRCDHQQW